eukprot:535411_1
MSKWNNNDTMNFIKSMNLPKIFEEKILGEIKDNLCTGQDIKMLKSSQDIGDAFNISEKKYLCDKICQKILHFNTPIIKENNNNLQTDVTFKINIFSQNKHLVLNEEVTKYETIQYIKTLYKIQSEVSANIDDIHFYYKRKLLTPHSTLQDNCIVNEKHLFSVKFGADNAILTVNR